MMFADVGLFVDLMDDFWLMILLILDDLRVIFLLRKCRPAGSPSCGFSLINSKAIFTMPG